MSADGTDETGKPERRLERVRSGFSFGTQPRRLDPGYTSFIRMLRVAFPIAAVAMIALIAVWPHLQKKNIAFTLGFVTNELSGDQVPVMVNPRYTGTDNNNRPYSITADLAHNLVQDSSRVDLDNPKADITLKNGTWLVVTADKGVYSRAGESLNLSGNVDLFQDGGYELMSDAVTIDLAAGSAESTVPSTGHGPFGQLTSEGFRVIDRGKTILFTGSSHLVLYPDAFGGKK